MLKKKRNAYYKYHHKPDIIHTHKERVDHSDKNAGGLAYFAKTYGVSNHAIDRYCERVLGLPPKIDLTHPYRHKIAKEIVDAIKVDFRSSPLTMTLTTEDFLAVVVNKIVVTIKLKEKDK